MFELLVVLLLRFKVHALDAAHLLTAAKIPLIATLLVVGTTGFTVTGQVQADEEGSRRFDLIVAPLENKTCVDALIAQTSALLEVDVLAGDAQDQLRRMRDRAFSAADDQHKVLDGTAARAQVETTSGAITQDLAATRARILAEADLGNCQDRNPDTGVVLDVADLRARYDKIVRDFGARLNGLLDQAQTAFDALVASAQPKPEQPPQAGSASHSRD